MRRAESGCAAFIAAAGVIFSLSLQARADEPVKPTAVGVGDQPGGTRARPFAARGGVQRWAAPCRAPHSRHG